VNGSLLLKILVVIMPMVYCVFSAIFGLVIGTKMAILNWTNEVAPIKQSGAILISIFGTWGFVVVFAGVFLLFVSGMAAELYIALFTVAFIIASALLLRWLDTKGAKTFARL
jgi:ABC-2 type transport system permease protein